MCYFNHNKKIEGMLGFSLHTFLSLFKMYEIIEYKNDCDLVWFGIVHFPFWIFKQIEPSNNYNIYPMVLIN